MNLELCQCKYDRLGYCVKCGEPRVRIEVTCFAEADTKGKDVPYRGALYFHRPSDDFWNGFADRLAQRGWSVQEIERLIMSKNIRHSWGDHGEDTALHALGAIYAGRFGEADREIE